MSAVKLAIVSSVDPIPQVVPEAVEFPDVHWCQLTKIGLKLSPSVRVDYDEWENLKPQLTIMGKGIQFGLGDWLAVGEAQHGEKAAQAIDAHDKTGIKVKTLMEYRRVSQKVPYSIRMESLDWSHHQLVADRPKSERKLWLRLSVENDWSPAELRHAIKEAASPSVNRSGSDYLDPNYKTFLLDYIASQYSFLNRCTYDPFKKEIEKAIKGAKYQSTRTLETDRLAVIARVNEGCCTIEEIEEEVPLSRAEIKSFFLEMVGSEPCLKKDPKQVHYSELPPIGDYEWRPIGQHSEMARGGRSFGCFRLDAPSGDDFRIPKGGNSYEPTIEYDED